MPPVEEEVALRVLQELGVVVVGVDAGVRLSTTGVSELADRRLAVVVAVQVRPQIARLGPERLGNALLDHELDTVELSLRGRNCDVRRLRARALRLRGVAAGVDEVAPVARVDSLPRRERAARAGVDDDARIP